RQTLRAVAPRVRPAADDRELAKDEGAMIARLPGLALRTARAALSAGPVLIQVPRRGYLAGIACARCRTQARCTRAVGDSGTQGSGTRNSGGQNSGTQNSRGQCNGPLRLAGPH